MERFSESPHLESGLQELSAGDDVRDLSLVQAVSDGRTSQCGVKGDHCNTHTHTHKTEYEYFTNYSIIKKLLYTIVM